MLVISNVSIPHNIFSEIYNYTNKTEYGNLALVCKGWFEAFLVFKKIQNLIPKKINEIKSNFLDSTGMKTLLQWEKAIHEKQHKDYEKLNPKIKNDLEERLVNLTKILIPTALETSEKFNKIQEEKSEVFPRMILDSLLNGIFNNFAELTSVLEPKAPPLDKKVVDITKNMIFDVMHSMLEPQNLAKMFERFSSGIQHVDADTPLGDILDHTTFPMFEIMHPVMAKHFDAMGCPLNEQDQKNMFEEIKKDLNQEFGTLNEYLRKTQLLEDTLDNALVELFGSSENLALINTSHTLSTYQVDLSNPKNDYEKGFALMLSVFPKEMTSEIQPMLSHVVRTMYAVVGCQTPEEFQERTEKLRELQKKANDKIGRLEILKQSREQLIAILMSQPTIKHQNLIKVNHLFDQMEQNPEVEKSFCAIYANVFQHFIKLLPSMLKIENIEENLCEIGGDIFDPLSTSKSTHLMTQKLMLQMGEYWKNLCQNITDPDLQLQYDVVDLELQAIIPSALRCQLHEKYERDLSCNKSDLLLANNENSLGKIQANPIKLSEFDRLIGKQFLSHQELNNMVDLLKSLPDNDEDSMVNKLIQKSHEDHHSFLSVFNHQNVKIEEVNE